VTVPSRTAMRGRHKSPGILLADPDREARSLRGLRLDGRELSMLIGDRLTGARLTRTMKGVDTLALDLWDGDRQVLTSGVLGLRVMTRVAEVTLDELTYTVAGDARNGDILTLTCEDSLITMLKRDGRGKPRHVSRGDNTRLQFCASLIRAAGVPCIALDELAKQPIAGRTKLREELAKARGKASGARGRSSTVGITESGLTIKGKPADKEQRRIMTRAAAACERKKAPPRAALALNVAIIIESLARNTSSGTGTSTGPLQVTAETARGAGLDPRDVDAVFDHFLTKGFSGKGGAIKIAREHPSIDAAAIAQMVQGSGAGEGSNGGNYRAALPEGRQWLRAQGGSDPGAGSAAFVKQYAFERRRGESTYACCRRLLDEVQMCIFAREGVIILGAETALARAWPSLVLRDGPGELLDQSDYERHRALRAGEANLRAWLGTYDADPGEVIELPSLPTTENFDWPNATWLIEQTDVDLLVRGPVDIKARLPTEPLKEPSSEVSQGASTDGDAAAGDIEGDIEAACKLVSGKSYPYVWGGGHAKSGTPDGGTGRDRGIGYDCSGSCGAALVYAGVIKKGIPVAGSGSFGQTHGLKPGRGKEATFWQNAEHIFIQGQGWRFDTGGPGGGNGPRYHKQTRPTGGFTPYHVPGH